MQAAWLAVLLEMARPTDAERGRSGQFLVVGLVAVVALDHVPLTRRIGDDRVIL